MNKHAIFHQAKSHLSYAYDHHTLHVLLQTSKEDDLLISLIHGDPFEWKDIDGRFSWVHHVDVMEKRYTDDLYTHYFISIKPFHKRVKYAFLIQHHQKTYLYGTQGIKEIMDGVLFKTYDLSHYFNFPYLNHEDVMVSPSWSKNMVWYQIFPDRFYTDHPKVDWSIETVHNDLQMGGDLKGITSKIPYLKDLGVEGVYFTPIFHASSMHKYDTIDYHLIDPQFGTNEDFKLLVETCHKHGIKVMLDGVFNHCGFLHPMFQDVVKHGTHSIYKDCFFIHEFPVVDFELNALGKPKHYPNRKNRYETFGFTPMMPKWNTSHPLVEDYLLDVVTYWIKHYDIDGWRLDVSNEVSHDFLRKLRMAARDVKKDTFILGENWDSSLPWLLGDQMDAVMNYDLSVPLWKFLEHQSDIHTFKHDMNRYLARTPKHVIDAMFNLVCSHDTIRIKKRLDDDARRMKIAYLLMFIQAGSPNIYYGDEVGMTGFHDPDNRRPMIWDPKQQDADMFSFMKTLIHLKKTLPLMSIPDLSIDVSNDLLIMKKQDMNQSLVIYVNYQDQPLKYIPDFKDLEILIDSGDLKHPYSFLLGVKHETNHS